MIDFDFTFLKPSSVEEAVSMYQAYDPEQVMYIGGATEFISRARMQEIKPVAVIDLKHIPECHVYEEKGDKLIIGSTIPLNTLIDHPKFPLLAHVCRSIATRTERNKITIGGNVCSHLAYQEARLPFLLTDSEIKVATEKGIETRDIHSLPALEESEFIVQFITDLSMLQAPFLHIKKTKQSNVNYPIVTLAMMWLDKEQRLAVSGLCQHPFREGKLEEIINDDALTVLEKAESVIRHLPDEILDDMHATSAFRTFLFETNLQQLLEARGEIL